MLRRGFAAELLGKGSSGRWLRFPVSGVPTHEVFPAGRAGVVGYRAVLVFNNDAVLRSRSVTRGIRCRVALSERDKGH